MKITKPCKNVYCMYNGLFKHYKDLDFNVFLISLMLEKTIIQNTFLKGFVIFIIEVFYDILYR